MILDAWDKPDAPLNTDAPLLRREGRIHFDGCLWMAISTTVKRSEIRKPQSIEGAGRNLNLRRCRGPSP